MRSRAYRVGQSTITLVFDDITTSSAEVLVSSDDQYLTMGGGVSGAICRAAGHGIEDQARKNVPAKVGDIVVTGAGRLRTRYVFHAITIGFDERVVSGEAIVRQSTRKAMELLPQLGCYSIAFPAIGAGAAHIPYQTVAAQMATTLVSFLLDSPTAFRVELYLLDRKGRMDPADFLTQFEGHVESALGLKTSGKAGETILTAPPPVAAGPTGPASGDVGEARRQQSVREMMRQLDARRDLLEASLIERLSQPEPVVSETLKEITSQLAEIRKLREIYQAELASVSQPSAQSSPTSVFVSSTAVDLKAHRQAVRDVIEGLKLRFIGMEDFNPITTPPAEYIQRRVTEADVYLGVLGMRYGSVDPSSRLSMTELEYQQAIASGKPVCMFVMDKDAPITPAMVEWDPESFSKLLSFRKRVLAAHVCALFSHVDDLKSKASKALQRLTVHMAV